MQRVVSLGMRAGGPRSADPGFSGFSLGSGGNSSRPLSLPVFTLVLLLLPFLCRHGFLSPLFPEARQPVCSRAQHWIRSQQLPLKLRCIITTSCSCSGRLAGRSANKRPDTRSSPGGHSRLLAAANPPKAAPTPSEDKRATRVPLVAPRGQLPPLFSIEAERVVSIAQRKVSAGSPAAALTLAA